MRILKIFSLPAIYKVFKCFLMTSSNNSYYLTMSSTKIFKSSYNRSGLSSVTNSGVASRCGRPVGEDFGPNQWSDSPAPVMAINISSAVSADQTPGVDDSNGVIVKRHGLLCRFKSLFSCNRKSVKNRVDTNESLEMIASEEYKPSVSYRIDNQNRVLSGEESLLNAQNISETQTDRSSDPLVLQFNNNRVDTKPAPNLMIETLVPQIRASGPEVLEANLTFMGEEAIGVSEHKRHGFYCRLSKWFRHRFESDVQNITEIKGKSESIHSEYLKPISSESDSTLIEENVNQFETNSGLNPAINGFESEMRSTADNSCPETKPQISAINQRISVDSKEQHISIGDNDSNTNVDKDIPEVCIVEKPIESECIPNQKCVRFDSKPEIVYKKDSKISSDSSSEYFSCNQNKELYPELEPELDPELEAIPELEEPIDQENEEFFIKLHNILMEPKIPVKTKEIIWNSLPLLRYIDIKLEKHIFTGGFGTVLGAVMGTEKVALKFTTKSPQKISEEIQVISLFSHKNVMNIIHIEEVENRFLIMDLAFGDLQDFIEREYKSSKKLLSFAQIRDIISDIISGVHHIHNKGFVHLDIKTINILIYEKNINGIQRITAKVSDFDFTQTYRRTEQLIQKRIRYGTQRYWSPEICEKQVLRDFRKADIWAIGITFYQIITFYNPFEKFPDIKDNNETDEHFWERKQKVLYQMKSDFLFDELEFQTFLGLGQNKTINGEILLINEEMIDLLKELLNPSEMDRKLLEEVINHRFLDKAIKRPNSFDKRRQFVFRKGMKRCF